MVYIILGTGFEDMEAICPCDILRRGGVEVQFAGIGGKFITGGNGVTVQADCTVEEIDFDKLEMIYGEKNVFTLAEMLLIAIQCSHFCIVLYMITYKA